MLFYKKFLLKRLDTNIGCYIIHSLKRSIPLQIIMANTIDFNNLRFWWTSWHDVRAIDALIEQMDTNKYPWQNKSWEEWIGMNVTFHYDDEKYLFWLQFETFEEMTTFIDIYVK